MDAAVDREAIRLNTLQSKANRFSFFQALREIENAFEGLPRIGRAVRPSDEAFRIGQLAELTFAPTAIRSVESDENKVLSIRQRSFGLLGPSGPMPTHFTEIVRNRDRHADDGALQEFLNLFHHRMATLFYRAWSSARPTVQRDRPAHDRFAIYLGSLAGVGLQLARSRDAWADEGKQFFAGRMGAMRRSAEGLESILMRTFTSPVRIEPFVLRQLQIPKCEVSQLGTKCPHSGLAVRSPVALGRSAVLGDRVADRQSLFQIIIGPMAFSDFERMMPQRPGRQTVRAIVQNYAGVGIDARVRLVLNRDQVPKPQLGSLGQLGRNAWLQSRPLQRDPDEYSFDIDQSTNGTLPTKASPSQ